MALTRLAEFRYLVRCWDLGVDRFEEIVECGTSQLRDGRQMLAKEFQVAKSTVDRWQSGVARPNPRLKRMIVGFLRQKLISSE